MPHKAMLLALILSVILSLPVSFAVHSTWHDHYTTFSGTRCCSSECIPLPVSLLNHDAGMVTLLVAGVRVTLQAGSVHRSEDAQSWVCLRNPQAPPSSANVRCAFWSVAS